MKLKFWQKEIKPVSAVLPEKNDVTRTVEQAEVKPEERSGFIRTMSHKHLTTRGRR